jgi:small subunit ribosomal protein S20
MRQERRRREHNRSQRSRIKTAVKKVMGAPNAESGKEALEDAYRMLDRLATRNIIHRNKAARKKSQLARHIASIGK